MYWVVICYITHFSFPPFCVFIFVILNMGLKDDTQKERKQKETNLIVSLYICFSVGGTNSNSEDVNGFVQCISY